MIRIGIIDDKQDERYDIQVSILDNVDNPETIEFKEYEILKRKKNELFQEIREDIIEGQLSGLIVDFKLDTTEDVISGTEVIDFMHKETPEFPVVIMTNVPDDSRKSAVVDADKVYPKVVFLDPERQETKAMVRNMMLNIQKYGEKRHRLEGMLDAEIVKLEADSENEKIIAKIMEIENELSRYKQIYQTSYNDKLDIIGELKEAASLLEEFKNLLGE